MKRYVLVEIEETAQSVLEILDLPVGSVRVCDVTNEVSHRNGGFLIDAWFPEEEFK